jgi:cytochrome c oxidase subunit 3
MESMAVNEYTEKEKRDRSKKMMLWFGIISMVMTFAGLTSAYVVSSKRPDWISDFELPDTFTTSTIVMIISSLTLFLAKRFLKADNRKMTSLFLFFTFLLGSAFVGLQIKGFDTLVQEGYYFTGPTSTINSSYIYVLVMAHLVHLAAGIIVLTVIIYNHFRKRYNSSKMLGFSIGSSFWHFVDILWLFLFLFLSFYK